MRPVIFMSMAELCGACHTLHIHSSDRTRHFSHTNIGALGEISDFCHYVVYTVYNLNNSTTMYSLINISIDLVRWHYSSRVLLQYAIMCTHAWIFCTYTFNHLFLDTLYKVFFCRRCCTPHSVQNNPTEPVVNLTVHCKRERN